MIMAGGSGTRLWPLSRRALPKQLVRLIDPSDRPGLAHGASASAGGRLSLLQLADGRLDGLIPEACRYICTNESYRDEITAQMPHYRADAGSDAGGRSGGVGTSGGGERILGEPVGRDTLNAVGFGAAVIHERDPDAVIAVLTADQIIEPIERFQAALETGFGLAEADARRLVTFSITPTYPATGFGYVEQAHPIEGFDGAYRVERFVEKPNAEKAQAYLESGSFGWNSGMFVWRASTILDCIRRYKPESYRGLIEIARSWETGERSAAIGRVYPSLPKISIDYAVMEPAAREQARTAGKASSETSVRVCTVTLDADWLDVGSWPSYGQTLTPDGDGNRQSGPSMLLESARSVVVNAEDAHTVALLGCEDLIVVHTADATLVMPRDRAQDLKTLHERLPDGVK